MERLEDRNLRDASSFDATFGEGGVVVTELGDINESLVAGVQQADGKYVAVGNVFFNNGGDNSDIVVVRYNEDGSLDDTFGYGGAGFVILDVGDNSANGSPSNDNDQAVDVDVDAEGNIIVTGTTFVQKDPNPTSYGGDSDIFVFRLEANGDVDTTFGVPESIGDADVDGDFYGGGLVLIDLSENTTDAPGTSEDSAVGSVIGPDGTIYVGGEAVFEEGINNSSQIGNIGFSLTRLEGADGAIDGDADFIQSPTTDFEGEAIARDAASGDIYIVGEVIQEETGGRIVAARFNADGSPDTTYGNEGLAFRAVDVTPGAGTSGSGSAFVTDAAVDSSGRLLIVGGAEAAFDADNDGDFTPGAEGSFDFYQDFGFVARFNAGGTLDTGFAGDGIQTFQFIGFEGEAFDTDLEAVAVDSAGRIVVTGFADSYGGGDVVGVARLDDDGSFDTSFSADGQRVLNLPVTGNDDYYVNDLILDDEDRIVLFGEHEYGGGEELLVVRLEADEPVDELFTPGNDVATLSFLSPTQIALTVNGQTTVFDQDDIPPDGFVFDGMGGFDEFIISDETAEAFTATISGGTIRIDTPSLSFSVGGIEEAYIYGTADDTVIIQGQGTFIVGWDDVNNVNFASLQSGDGSLFAAAIGTNIFAYSTGTSDVAIFTDSPADSGGDYYVLTPEYGENLHNGQIIAAVGFSHVQVFGEDPTDVAIFYDSVGDDTFVSNSENAFLSGDGYVLESNLSTSVVIGNAGGNDTAVFLAESSGDHFVTFEGAPIGTFSFNNFSYLTSTVGEYTDVAFGFENVFGQSEVSDATADVFDSPGDDAAVATGDEFTITTGARERSAIGFSAVTAHGTQGGNNTLNLDAIDYLLTIDGTFVEI